MPPLSPFLPVNCPLVLRHCLRRDSIGTQAFDFARFPGEASVPSRLLPAPSPWRRSTGLLDRGLRKEEALKTPWWWRKHPFPPPRASVSDEFVRHKILDLLGDLYLLSAGLSGPGWSP